MKDIAITDIIEQTLSILEKEVGLAKSTLLVVASRSFKPIVDFFGSRNEASYSEHISRGLTPI